VVSTKLIFCVWAPNVHNIIFFFFVRIPLHTVLFRDMVSINYPNLITFVNRF
jgi:hypothetical protein